MNFDFTPIVISFFSSFWYLIPIVVLISLFRTSWFKGIFGEFQVNLAAKWFLDKDKYHVIKNVTLPAEDGTTQIDHIVVSKFGIFVIETKNMKGWIFGSEKQRTWTQKIYKHTSKFQNPLHQNFKHTKTLQGCLDVPDNVIFSLVVFVGDSTFKTRMPENVTYAGGYIRFIKSKTELILSDSEVRELVQKIQSARLAPSIQTHKEHVAHVKSIIEDKPNTCPKCGRELVVRTVKKGQNAGSEFLACSGFPQCRYATSINKNI